MIDWPECLSVCACLIVRESEDTVLMILKQIYSAMGITPVKSGSTEPATALPSVQQSMNQPQCPPPVQRGFPISGSQFTSTSGNVPMMFTPPSQISSGSGIGGPPLPAAPINTTYLDPSPLCAGGQPHAAVGPPPRSGFVRK